MPGMQMPGRGAGTKGEPHLRLRLAMQMPLNTVTRRLFSGTDSFSSMTSPGPNSGRCSSAASAASFSASSV